jgi:hypothetical protein
MLALGSAAELAALTSFATLKQAAASMFTKFASLTEPKTALLAAPQ